MKRYQTQIVRLFLRLTAPRSFMDFVLKLLIFVSIIHLISITAEYLLTGSWSNVEPLDRLLITAIAATPFCWVGLTAIKVSYQLQNKLIELASTDTLTNLPNRRAFLDQAEARLSAGQAAQGMLGMLLLLDADHFKRINDTWGHPAGDLCLKALSNRLRSVFRPEELVGRVGGEEFAAFVGNSSHARLEKLRTELVRPVTVYDRQFSDHVSLTFSVGVAIANQGDTLKLLFRRADLALYQAKSNGRARVEVWQPEFNIEETSVA